MGHVQENIEAIAIEEVSTVFKKLYPSKSSRKEVIAHIVSRQLVNKTLQVRKQHVGSLLQAVKRIQKNENSVPR